MKDLQLSVYDLVSILFPSTLLLAIFRYQQGFFDKDGHLAWAIGNIWPSAGTMPSFASFTIIFVVAYVLGQALNLLAKWVEGNTRLNPILFYGLQKRALSTDPEQNMVFNRKTVPVILKKQIGVEILQRLEHKYGVEFTPADDLTDYAIQSLSDRALTKRDLFMATAGMMRNIAVISVGLSLFFLLHAAYIAARYDGASHLVVNDLLYTLVALGCWWIFRYGFVQYRMLVSRVMLVNFYAQTMPKALEEEPALDQKMPLSS